MKALVLSGGGAKGAYEAGLVSSLIEEFGEQFDIICGTSIGAINAAFIAQDDTAQLRALWRNIGTAHIVSPLPRVADIRDIYTSVADAFERRGWSRVAAWLATIRVMIRGLRSLNPLTELMALTGMLDPRNTQQLLAGKLDLARVRRVLVTTTTDLAVGAPEVFCHFPAPYDDLRAGFLHAEAGAQPYAAAAFAETIRASGAIPAAFSPVTLANGSTPAAHVDGGVTNNTPIGQAIDAGADEVTVVYLDPLPDRSAPAEMPKSIGEILLTCFSIMQQRILQLDYQTALRVNDAVGAAAHDTTAKHLVKLRTFRPKTPLPVGILDFGRQDLIDAGFAQGQIDARNPAARADWQS